MIWRACTPADTDAVLRLTREPMGGKIRLAWGLERLESPPDCEHLRAYLVEDRDAVVACAMSWDWPGGHRYLGGLRFADDYRARPRPKFWKQAFETLLDGTDHAWTCIGAGNTRARRLLESGASWLPTYYPRQTVTTWFIPLPQTRRNGAPPATRDTDPVRPLDWRHAAIAAGGGAAYRFGRLLFAAGMPGVPPPYRRIRLAEFRPAPEADARSVRAQLEAARGYDALIVVLPDDSREASVFRRAAPRFAWTWRSTLYSVNRNAGGPLPQVPNWRGSWL